MKFTVEKVIKNEFSVDTTITPDLPLTLVDNLSRQGKKTFQSLTKGGRKIHPMVNLPKTRKEKIIFILRASPKSADELLIAYYKVFGEFLERQRLYQTIHKLRQEGIVQKKDYRLEENYGK